MRLWRSVCIAAGLAALTAFPAQAQPSGTVVAAIQMAEADQATGKIVLAPEVPIFSGDKIVTGPIGEAQIRFRDNTKLVVGPNSQMVIDAFVFSGDTPRNVSINAVRGAFRFITGNGPKDAYRIVTPTATIGVRGTEFDVDVDTMGTTRVVNFTGVTRICDRFPDDVTTDITDPERQFRGCIEARDPCGVSVIQKGKDIRRFTDTNDRNRELNWYFRYVRDQSRLLPDFQVSMAGCSDRSPQRIQFSSTPTPEFPPPEPPCKHKCGPHPDKPHKPHDKPHDKPWDKPHDKPWDKPSYHHDDNDEGEQPSFRRGNRDGDDD